MTTPENLWQRCDGPSRIAPLNARPVRVVESQEQAATSLLVDSAAEQLLLERILEESKPPLPPEGAGYHYLITTPFRYPPLKYGSRFGTRTRCGIFYGSLAVRTALAECAYYRLLFWHGMTAPPPRNRLDTEHTSFTVRVKTRRGIRLEEPPFDRFRQIIAHPADYRATQRLGEAMYEEGVEAFSYPSARDPAGGINLAVFRLAAIASRKPADNTQWLCTTRADEVSFVAAHSREARYRFPLETFLHDGRLPQPALT